MPLKDDDIFLTDKQSAYNFRSRRHSEWTENYTLYRDKPSLNRLTQRQSVSVPLMKYTVKTLLKDIDEPPVLYFQNLDNDAQAEVFYNESWKYSWKFNKGVIKDIVDKRQILLFGRSFKKLNIVDGKFFFEIVDPQDILVDRYVDPSNLETARFIIHTHIFRPLASLEMNDMYDQNAVRRLKQHYASKEGLIQADQSIESMQERNKRMAELGVTDVDNPVLGETYVELNECYKFEWDNEKKKDVLKFSVYVDDMEELFKAPLEDIIGKTQDNFWDHNYNFTTWADDVERTDFWSDAVGDIIRTPNKILNSWVSQLVENRTLRNFGMHYYDSKDEKFIPQTFQPTAWGWYPVPGNPKDVIKKVDIPDLSNSLDEMKFVLDIADKASAASAASQGTVEKNNVTLGEVQLALANAKERVKSMATLYTDSWQEFGYKYIKMLEAASDRLDSIDISKVGREGKRIWTRTISPTDYASKKGYVCDVRDVGATKDSDMESINKLNATRALMPNNPALGKIYKKKALEFAGLSATEVKEVLDVEEQQLKMLMNPMLNGQPGVPGATQPMPQGAPVA